MKTQDYHNRITTKTSPKETFNKISQVSNWWSKNIEGSFSKVGDVFTSHFKSGDWYKIKIDEMIPDKKIVWNVIGSDQTWHEDREEWTGTKIVWEISPVNPGSEVSMTHIGLIPEAECYDQCKKG